MIAFEIILKAKTMLDSVGAISGMAVKQKLCNI